MTYRNAIRVIKVAMFVYTRGKQEKKQTTGAHLRTQGVRRYGQRNYCLIGVINRVQRATRSHIIMILWRIN